MIYLVLFPVSALTPPPGSRLLPVVTGLRPEGAAGGSRCAARGPAAAAPSPAGPEGSGQQAGLLPGPRRRAGAAGGLVLFVRLRLVCKYLFVCGRPRGRCAGRGSQGARFPASAGLGKPGRGGGGGGGSRPRAAGTEPRCAPGAASPPGQRGPRLCASVAAEPSGLLVARQGAVRTEGMPALGRARSCCRAPCRRHSRGPASSGEGRESTNGNRGEKGWARAACVAETTVPPSSLNLAWPCGPPAPPAPFASWYSCTCCRSGENTRR